MKSFLIEGKECDDMHNTIKATMLSCDEQKLVPSLEVITS